MISICLPSRGRPDGLAEMVESALETAAHPDDIEILVRLDGDDPAGYRPLRYTTYIPGPRTCLSMCWNEVAALARGDILMHAGDDIRFRTPGWDTMVADAFPDDGIALLHGRDGIHDAELGTHSFVTRKWVETIGWLCPPYFSSDFNDTWLCDVADRIGRRIYLDQLETEHLHPVAGKAEWDRTHQERLERHARDRVDDLYAVLEPERWACAQQLQAVMS